jgi:hypothetical protein
VRIVGGMFGSSMYVLGPVIPGRRSVTHFAPGYYRAVPLGRVEMQSEKCFPDGELIGTRVTRPSEVMPGGDSFRVFDIQLFNRGAGDRVRVFEGEGKLNVVQMVGLYESQGVIDGFEIKTVSRVGCPLVGSLEE